MGSIAIPSGGGGNNLMPYIKNVPFNASKQYFYAEKNRKYTISSSGDAAIVFMNGYTGKFKVTENSYAGTKPTIRYVDGTTASPTYNTIYDAKNVIMLEHFVPAGHLYQYDITFL